MWCGKAGRPEYRALPWPNQPDLARWQAGRTGYPIIDAAMRQLKLSGRIRNRLRMLCAGF